MKGEYDKYKDRFDIMVTGSARLDLYSYGGDSLLGRYHYMRLHPFSVREALGLQPTLAVSREPKFTKHKNARDVFVRLFRFGGFPEPFIKKDLVTLRRFHNERLERLIKEDIRDIENVRDISALQILVELLPAKVGSLLSVNSLKGDLGVTHKTVSAWTDILERFYYHFRMYPFAATSIKSLRKEPKMYLWDWSQIEDEAIKLENIVASHLLKTAHFFYDTQGYRVELKFIRDTEGREVDFLLTVNKKPWMAVEVTSHDQNVSKNLKYFAEKLNIPFVYQVVGGKDIDVIKNGVRVISADTFLSALV